MLSLDKYMNFDSPKLNKNTWLAIWLLALYPLVPMPIAGGLPFQIALLFALFVSYVLRGQLILIEKASFTFLFISCLLITWEIITATYHGGNKDYLYVFARGLWIANSLLVMLIFMPWVRSGRVDIVFRILVVSLILLLSAMVIESTFFPKREIGRQLGTINIPFPRATGVPNSDGKIGTFLVLCWSFFLFVCPKTKRPVTYILGLGPLLGLAFTQSRSTLVAFAVTFAIYMISGWFLSQTFRRAFIRTAFFIATFVLIVIYGDQILASLVGEGIYQRNVTARFDHFEYGFSEIAQAPIFGSGAESIREEVNRSGIHNTVLAMSVKSGVFAGLLILLILLAPVWILRKRKIVKYYVLSCSMGFLVEHLLYPGFINEFVVFSLLIPLTVSNHIKRNYDRARENVRISYV